MEQTSVNKAYTIIHIAPDEKFINFANEFFEDLYPKCNIFYILSDSQNLKYVEKRDNINIVSTNQLASIAKENSLSWHIAFFHSLVLESQPIVQNINKNCIKMWFCFGFEVYNDPSILSERKLYFIKTYEQIIGSNKLTDRIKQNRYFRKLYRRLIKPSLYLTSEEQHLVLLKQKKQLFSQIDVLVSSFVEESENIQHLLQLKHFKRFEFWYSTIECDDIKTENECTQGDQLNILIGNSAAPVCNHIDVFDKLAKLKIDFQDSNIILPLSYGGNKNYINSVKFQSKQLTSFNIIFIEQFMSLNEYQALLSTCSIAIIASRRQHAVSNAVILIAKGVKLFLSIDNPFFHYLKRIGIFVFSFENDLNRENITPLSEEEKRHNKITICEKLNKKNLQLSVNSQIEEIFSNENNPH